MRAEAPPIRWRLAVHRSLGSTADLVAQAAAAGDPEGLAVLARCQTAGRGRTGRSWESPEGNLHLSVLLRPRVAPMDLGQWSLLAAVALLEAASAVVPEPTALQLKWPNDLMLDRAKCAGILAESALAPDGSVAWLSLGFGVNLAHAPDIPERPTAHLGAPESPELFARRLLDRLGHWRARVARQGFAGVRRIWQGRTMPVEGTITISTGGRTFAGRIVGLADDGALLLHDGETTRRIVAGEVVAGERVAGERVAGERVAEELGEAG